MARGVGSMPLQSLGPLASRGVSHQAEPLSLPCWESVLLFVCSKRVSPRQAAGVIDAVGRSFSKSLASDPSSPGLWQWRQWFLARLLGGGAGARACADFATPI